MKGRFWKKLTAGALAALVMSGGIPMQPIADLAHEFSITASAEGQEAITYLDENGNQQTIDSYTLVTDYTGTVTQKWSEGNYVVQGNVTISVTGNDAISFSDTVNLILCDNAHLNVKATGSSKNAIARGRKLNIFAQSTGENKGELTAEGDFGISCVSLNVYGGKVALNGTSYGLYLYNNSEAQGLTVNGGDVTITNNDNNQAAIKNSGNDGHLTVNDGTLTVSNSAGGNAIDNIASIAFNGGAADITGSSIYRFSTLDMNGGNVTLTVTPDAGL